MRASTVAHKKSKAEQGERLDLRASRAEKELIKRGAAKRKENVSRFIVRSACVEAEIALSEERNFVLNRNKMEEFMQALDRPARVIPALKKLFSEPSILEP